MSVGGAYIVVTPYVSIASSTRAGLRFLEHDVPATHREDRQHEARRAVCDAAPQ